MEVWYDEAIREVGNDGGSYTDLGEPKGLLHTTEGKSYAGAKAAYQTNDSWPHFTVTYENGFFRCFQHNPIDIASRALKNLPGGIQTNRDRIIQIEMVGTCDTAKRSWGAQYVENFPQPYLNGIGRLMRWCEKQLLIPRRCPLKFLPYPASAGNSPVRLSMGAFDLYSGWLGHQHAAENNHGDPGLINITYLLTVGVTAPPTDKDWFDMATKAELEEVVRKVNAGVLMQGFKDGANVGPSYIVASDFSSKYHMDGWDNVELAVNLQGVRANGEVDGHPKPFPIDPDFLNEIPTTATT